MKDNTTTKNKVRVRSKLQRALYAAFAFSTMFNISHAQESAAATGGDAMGNGGTVAYSIGQVVYTTNTENAGSVAQGVQHAYEIFTVGINETTLQISLSVYPNPISENLNLIVSNLSNEKLSYQLVDIQGKLIGTGEVTSQQTQINTSSLAAATYFIHVLNQQNQNIQSFKIVKQ